MEPGANTGPRLTPVQTQLIAAAFEEAAHDGAVVEPDQVERIAAGLLGGVLTDGMLDTIIDATDGKDGIDATQFDHIMKEVLVQTCAWGTLQTPTNGPVGITAILDQVKTRAKKRGFDFNLMVVGESGLGKTTLVDTLFRGKISSRSSEAGEGPKPLPQTTAIHNVTHGIEEDGIRVRLTVTDTPGFGDQVDNTLGCDAIVTYIKDQHDAYITMELSKQRAPRIPDSRVHALLYFIAPTSHGLKPLDIAFMKQVHTLVNVVPLIAKADALTLHERAAFKALIREDLEHHEIRTFPWTHHEDDEDDEDVKEAIRACLPFAVVGATEQQMAGTTMVRGRQTRWGFINVDDPEHCELPLLRDTLIRTHLLDLKDTTASVHYESYRESHLG